MKAEVKDFIFINIKGSQYIYSVVTADYFNLLQKNLHRAPAQIYERNEYVSYSCPFTFSTLTENLPFKITPVGGFRMNAAGLSQYESNLLTFHIDCIAVYKKYDLAVDRLWFDYLQDSHPYAHDFKRVYEQFIGATEML